MGQANFGYKLKSKRQVDLAHTTGSGCIGISYSKVGVSLPATRDKRLSILSRNCFYDSERER